MVRQTEEESDDGSSSVRKPKGAKCRPTVSEGDLACYSRAHLGERLYQETPGFDLTDPNMHLANGTYNCLHDPHLRTYFQKPERKKRLIHNGFITADQKVLCTIKEYNNYSKYTESVQLSWQKLYFEQQRKLMKEFLIMKEKGLIPPHIHISDMIDWLVRKGTDISKKMFQKQSGNTQALLKWEVNRRLKLEAIQKEACREYCLERKLPFSQRVKKASVECIPCPGSSGAGPRCLSSLSEASVDLVSSSVSIEEFPRTDSVTYLNSFDSITPGTSVERSTVLSAGAEKVICETVKDIVMDELRRNLLPVLMRRQSSSESIRHTSDCSDQSYRSLNTAMVRPKSSASVLSDGVTSPSTGDNTTESYIGTTFYTEVPISERLCYDNFRAPAGCLIVPSNIAASTVDNAMLRAGLRATTPEQSKFRCMSVQPLTIPSYQKKGVKLLGGMPTDVKEIPDVEDTEVEVHTPQFIHAITQQLSETSSVCETAKEGESSGCMVTSAKSPNSAHQMSVEHIFQDNTLNCVNTTRALSPRHHSPNLANSVAAVLYHNISETETSKKPPPYSSSQVTCIDSWQELTGSGALREFSEPLSESALDLLKGTFGERAQSLKTEKSEFQCITVPTSEKLFFVSHVNSNDTVVHKVAIEELPAVDVIQNTIPPDHLKRLNTPFSSRLNTPASARHFRQSSPTIQLLQGVVEKLVAKMVVRLMSIPEEFNDAACKQLEKPCHSLDGPLSEFHHGVISRLCPVLVTDIMESLSSEIVSPPVGESASQSPLLFTEDEKSDGKSRADSPNDCAEEFACFQEGNSTTNEGPSEESIIDFLKLAMTDIESAMTYSKKQVCSNLPARTEVVVDIITKLVSDIESGTNSPTSPLTNVVVDMVMSVLDNLSEVSTASSPDNLEYSRPASSRIVSTVRKELEDQIGSTDALKHALNCGSEDVTKAISTAVAREVSVLLSESVACHLASTSSSASLLSLPDTTSAPAVRPLTAAVIPNIHPDSGLLPNHRSSSSMERKPVVMVVNFDTVRDIVSRLLVQLLPKGFKDFNLADCSLFDVIFSELSSSLFVRLTRKRQKATVCLDSVEVSQVVLSVQRDLVKLYGPLEHFQNKVFNNCPTFFGGIAKLIVKGILKSPTRKPTEINANPYSDETTQGTPHLATPEWRISIHSIDDLLSLLLNKMQEFYLVKAEDAQFSRALFSYLTINIMDMTLKQLQVIPGLVLVDKEENFNKFLKEKIVSNVHSALVDKGITVKTVHMALQQGSSSALNVIRDELIKETIAVCSSSACAYNLRSEQGQTETLLTKTVATVTSTSPAEARKVDTIEYSAAASNTVDNVLQSAMDKEKMPKRKRQIGRIFLRIFKGVRHSFTSCNTSRVMD
ncbi:uncharacterized protein LOC125300741 [Alosa alosa]|uniref:uncharacterized protein LOC125300741 n=1 Tax=Alosa alosa TaxID=278164 RepID=UPI0020153DD9|nr:uncharacterized protein LOC125300741 [Alosa alosa]